MEASVNIQTPVSTKPARSQAEEAILRLFNEVADGLPASQNADLAQLRKQAIAEFDSLGLPHRRIEAWKYTDLRARLTDAFPFTPHAGGDVSEAELRDALGSLADIDAHVLVFVNGTFRAELSKFDSGLEFTSLPDALEQQPDWFQALLGKVNTPERDAVFAINTAFMNAGAAIRVSGEQSRPVHLMFVSAGETPASIACRNVVSVEKNAQVTLVEHHVSLNDTAVQSYHVTELAAEDGARVEHIKVQEENPNTTHLANWNLRLGKGVRYNAMQLNSGGALARNQIFLCFTGEGTQASINGAVLQRGAQHCDLTMVIDHSVPECTSRELVKSVLEDRARAVFQGKVIVRPGAQKTDGKQMAQALLLSDEAEFDSKPELEIYADDVVCGHGSTSGQLDDDLLFYLRARGIPEHEARALLIAAFIDEVLDHVGNDDIRDALRVRTAAWLGSTELANA